MIVAGYMVPHPPLAIAEVGRGQEGQIQATLDAYDKVACDISDKHPDTVILSSPHSIMYADYFHISPGKTATGDMSRFGCPQVSFSAEYDTELVSLIERIAQSKGISAGTMGERDASLDHGTMVPLHFICRRYTDFKLIRIGLSGLPLTEHYRMGMAIAEAVNALGRNAVYVASGDLSHKMKAEGPYGFAPEGPQYDERIMNDMGSADFAKILDYDEGFCDRAAECGHRSFVMMAGAFDGVAVRPVRLTHEATFGVGYGICMFTPGESDEKRHFLDKKREAAVKEMKKETASNDPYVTLAIRSLKSYINNGIALNVTEAMEGLENDPAAGALTHDRAGAFVSIHKHGQLRGCIGTFLPVTDCIASEIIRNAISASTEDPRFSPIRPDEIPDLEVNVDVLSTPEAIPDESFLDVKRYGVIVTRGSRRGLLLPDLEGVDDVVTQIAIAKQKAGIPQDADVELQRFEVVRHK